MNLEVEMDDSQWKTFNLPYKIVSNVMSKQKRENVKFEGSEIKENYLSTNALTPPNTIWGSGSAQIILSRPTQVHDDPPIPWL